MWCVPTAVSRKKVKVSRNNYPRNEMTCVVNKIVNFSSEFDACFFLKGAVQSYLMRVMYKRHTH